VLEFAVPCVITMVSPYVQSPQSSGVTVLATLTLQGCRLIC